MSFGDTVKNLVSKAAPMLGSLMGGPAGGAIGGMIASALGVEPTETAIEQALKTDPNAAIKLAEIESSERVRLQELTSQQASHEITAATEQVKAVNLTMQAEGRSEHWPQWSWRPFWGFISGLAFFVVCIFVCTLGYQAVIKGRSEAFGQIPLVIGAFTTLFSIPGAILGVAAWHRGMEKREKKA